jgi:hypothetical protein
MGYSRENISRFTERYDDGGEAALQEVRRRKPAIKNRVAPESAEAGSAIALEQPAWARYARRRSEPNVEFLFRQQAGAMSGHAIPWRT